MSAFVNGGVALRPVQGRAVSCRRQRHAVSMVFGRVYGPGYGAPKVPKEDPYEIFGITEDADFDKVEAAYREMLAKHSSDEKMLMQIEITKEDIMKDKLEKNKIKAVGFDGVPVAPPLASAGSNPYSLFGISKDADYEEVESAYRRLLMRNAMDEKMIMKVEMTKDLIMADRLQK